MARGWWMHLRNHCHAACVTVQGASALVKKYLQSKMGGICVGCLEPLQIGYELSYGWHYLPLVNYISFIVYLLLVNSIALFIPTDLSLGVSECQLRSDVGILLYKKSRQHSWSEGQSSYFYHRKFCSLEERQRAERRNREAKGDKFTPKWFDMTDEVVPTPWGDLEVYQFNGKYTEHRAAIDGADIVEVVDAQSTEFNPWQYSNLSTEWGACSCHFPSNLWFCNL